MDKYEYKVRADEIKELIANGEYAQAAEIADTIDWRRVKSVMMLCTISDLYKINRRYEDAKNMLLLAYERRPGGRTICYALCELCIKTEEFVQALKYYEEFVQAAPRDPGRYILQYRLYEAQDVRLEERIGVLEELKKRDYREKWAYELAYLYHRVGLATRCVEECDELILWFGEGKYVIKAMELKMLHQPLSPEQQEKYDHRFDAHSASEEPDGNPEEASAYDDMEEETEQADDRGQIYEQGQAEAYGSGIQDAGLAQGDTQIYEMPGKIKSGARETAEPAEEMDIHVKTMDMGEYNTLNLQAELAAGLQEILGDEKSKSAEITRTIVAPMMETESLDYPEISDEDISEDDVDDGVEQIESTEVFLGETGELDTRPPETEEQKPEADAKDTTAETVMSQLRMENIGKAVQQAMTAQPPREMAGVLAQEADGQISFVMPERETVEKQITGQMSIADILSEWEQMKKETEERRKEEVRQRVLQQTGPMFTEFEAAARDGLLEQLEKGQENGGSGQPAEEPEDSLPEEEAGASGNEQPDEEFFVEEPDDSDAVEESEEILEEDQFLAEEEPGEESREPEEFYEETASEEEDQEPYEETEFYEVDPEEDDAEFYEETSLEEETVDEPEKISEKAGGSGQEMESRENAAGPEQEAQPEKGPEPESQDPEDGQEPVEREKAKVRALTREEKELFAPYIQSRSSREQLVKALDNISMASYTGNVIVTGGEGMDTSTLAKNMIREVQMTDSNFSGKVAKISGQTLNKKDVADTLQQLKNGALIIQKASGMEAATVEALHKALQGESLGIIVVMEDTRKAMGRLLEENKMLEDIFTARMDVEALSNDMLVSFGRQYAKSREYSIDDLGVLALHTRIEERQTLDHAVTVMEVKEIVDGAIRHANRKTIGHFIDVLLAKRYDEDDMIVLTEKDFA